MHRDTDRARLIGDRPRDRLTNPPRCIGREFEALRVVKALDGTHQAEVALLDEIKERHAPTGIALGNRHHEAKVRLGQLLFGPQSVLDGSVELSTGGERQALQRVVGGEFGQLGLRSNAGGDAGRERDLAFGVQQRDASDLAEVLTHRISGGTGPAHVRRTERRVVPVVHVALLGRPIVGELTHARCPHATNQGTNRPRASTRAA